MGGICNKKSKEGESNDKKHSSRIHQDHKKGSDEKKNVIKSTNNTQARKSGEIATQSKPPENISEDDIDLQDIGQNFKEYLNSKETPNEKLRVALKILKDLADEEVQKNSETNVDKFFRLIEKHYRKLYDFFEKTRQSCKPLIKLLQIFELFLDNFEDKALTKKIVDRIYNFLNEKNMMINDWRFLRKLCEQRKNDDLKILASWRADLVQGFYRRVKKTKKALLWKDETEGTKYAREVIDSILTLSEEILFEFLLMGRFDKEKTKIKESFSMIVGDEGGIFLLINKVPPGSRQEKLILNSGVSEEFLREKRGESDDKVILGKGSFGKVRLALSILGSLKVDIGQLVCVKKSLPIGEKKSAKTNLLKNIADSTLEDFFASKVNELIHAPMPVDMAILSSKLNENKHRKGYLFMELVPENTADKIFGEEENYRKWEYQKPYILAVLKTTNDMLVKDRVFNSDLKPPNTLFDVLSRKMAIIDLGSSLKIKKEENLLEFDASVGGFGYTEPYCAPEILDEEKREKLNLLKVVSYLCGVTIAEVTCGVPADKKARKSLKNWDLTAKNTDLDDDSKKKLIVTLKGLTEENPITRMDISDAITSIEKIGLEADYIMKKATSEQYINKLRKLIKENPSMLSLNEDINETREKGIIDQMVVESNPKRIKHQRTKALNKELDEFLNNNMKGEEEKLFVLLGEAGSGKSLALQLRFIKEVEEWKYGKHALPLFFNMAVEVNLEKVVNRLNAMLGCNIKLDDPNNDEIHLFIDSYDEGRPGDIKQLETEQEGGKERNDKKNQPGNNFSIIEQYFENISKWKKPKLVISCRTDFVQREGDDSLSEFQVRHLKSMSVRYIAPVDYQTAQEGDDRDDSEKSEMGTQVKDWLNREKRKEDPEEIIKILKKLALEARMGTGLMFNMIMKMVLKLQKENLNDLRLKGFEIYSWTIQEEFRVNWEKVVTGKGSSNNKSEKQKEQFIEINDEIQRKFKLDGDEIDRKRLNSKDGKELVWEGLERIGELLAAEMSLNKSNRIRYSEVERILTEKVENTGEDMDFDIDLRTEWKTLY